MEDVLPYLCIVSGGLSFLIFFVSSCVYCTGSNLQRNGFANIQLYVTLNGCSCISNIVGGIYLLSGYNRGWLIAIAVFSFFPHFLVVCICGWPYIYLWCFTDEFDDDDYYRHNDGI